MFRQRLWMIPVAQWVGLVAAFYAVMSVLQGLAWWWLVVWAIGHMLGGVAVSAGLHRYFTHGSFKTTKFWHNVLAFYSTLTIQDSPIAWAGVHTTHHSFADKDGDPHETGLSYLIRKHYKKVPLKNWRVKQLVKDPTIRFVHRNAILIVLSWVSMLLIFGALTGSGILPLVFGYLAPLGSSHWFGAVHQVISHRGGGARNLPVMEWLLPAAGEWMHKHHHENPRDPRMGQKWYHLDYGWLFIKMIRTD